MQSVYYSVYSCVHEKQDLLRLRWVYAKRMLLLANSRYQVFQATNRAVEIKCELDAIANVATTAAAGGTSLVEAATASAGDTLHVGVVASAAAGALFVDAAAVNAAPHAVGIATNVNAAAAGALFVDAAAAGALFADATAAGALFADTAVVGAPPAGAAATAVNAPIVDAADGADCNHHLTA